MLAAELPPQRVCELGRGEADRRLSFASQLRELAIRLPVMAWAPRAQRAQGAQRAQRIQRPLVPGPLDPGCKSCSLGIRSPGPWMQALRGPEGSEGSEDGEEVAQGSEGSEGPEGCEGQHGPDGSEGSEVSGGSDGSGGPDGLRPHEGDVARRNGRNL